MAETCSTMVSQETRNIEGVNPFDAPFHCETGENVLTAQLLTLAYNDIQSADTDTPTKHSLPALADLQVNHGCQRARILRGLVAGGVTANIADGKVTNIDDFIDRIKEVESNTREGMDTIYHLQQVAGQKEILTAYFKRGLHYFVEQLKDDNRYRIGTLAVGATVIYGNFGDAISGHFL